MKKRFFAALLSFIMIFSLLPVNALAARNSTVVLHPSVGSTVTGVKVKVGDKIDGHKISKISGNDITVDLGKYNVNNDTFRLPYAKAIWYGVDNNKVDYISWAGSGSNKCSEGASALLANGGNIAYYYFKGAPVLLTFTLNYDANGGTGAPASQTYKATSEYEKSHTFTISSQAPTRDGYTFLGWSTNKNVASASYQPGGSIVVTGTTTLYAVWEEEAPPTPDKPTAPGEGDLSTLIGQITVNCTNEAATHTPKSNNYALIKDSYTTSEVEGDAESGYTYTVTIDSQKYVEQFDNETSAAHDPKSGTATIALKYEDNGWTVTSGIPVVFNVACKTEIVPPTKPGAEDLAKLEAPVEVVCTTKPETHTAASFALIEGTYTVGDVLGNETDGYTCDITVTADEYVTKYNTDFGAHTLTGDNTKPLTLKYVEGRWIFEETVTFNVECKEELFSVHLVIYRNGDTSKAYKTVDLGSQPKGTVIDLSKLAIGDYYTANYTGKYDFYGWYNDGTWNVYKKNLANPPAGLKEITVNGWTNIIGMVYDYENVVYFQSAEDLAAYQKDHSKTEGLLYTTTARFGSTLPTADAPTVKRTGHNFKFWSREGQNSDVTGQTVTGWTNLYANWEKKSYTVVAKLYVNGEPAYYQNQDFYTYQVTGLYDETIDYSGIEAEAIAQAEKLHDAAASYTAELYDDGKTAVCTKFGEDQPNEATHYVNINIKTTEHVYVYRMFDGEMETTEYHHTTAPYGANVNEYLNTNVTNLDVPGYTHEEWFNKGVPALDAKFGENDTIRGWTNVVIKYTKSEYPVIYRYESSDPSVPVPYQVTATRPTNDYTYAPGELVRVAMMPETVEIGEYVWTFKTWRVNGIDVVPNSQVEMTEGGLTIVGIWERTEKEYGVTYQYANSIPTEVWATLPANADTYTVGQKVTTARPNPDVVDVDGYRWTFKTWQLNGVNVASNTEVAMASGGLTFNGVWERTELPAAEYGVTYKYDNSVPEEVKATLPTNSYTYAVDEKVTTARPNPDVVDVNGYRWTFKTWQLNGIDVASNTQIPMVEGGLTFVGIWERTELPPAEYGVTYKYDNSVPEEVKATLPTNSYTYAVDEKVTTARPNPDVVDVNGYRWTFKTWQLNGIDVASNTQIPMVEGGLTFVGVWERTKLPPVRHPSPPSKPTLNTGDHFAYVMGYPDGTVRPNGSITRAEVSTILFRLLSDKTREEYFTTESNFTDVKAGAWYNNSVATLEKAGVIVDTAKGGAFRPNEAITRAELAAMLAQFSDAKPVKGVKFSDVSADHWAYDAIAIAAKMGWIEGYPDGTFRPDATITRAEMMTLVNRALERVPSDEDHLLSKRAMLTFPDCTTRDWFYIAVQEATNSHSYERAATEKNGDEQWTALRDNRDWTKFEQ